MPKDSKTPKSKAKKKAGKPSPFKGKQGNKAARILQRATAASAQAPHKVGPIEAPRPGMAIIPYNSDDKHVHKISRGLYTDELLPVVEALAGKGYTNNEIARSLGVGERTFYEWREKYPQFAQAIAKYRGVVTSLVENAFINNCLGYSFIEEQLAGNGMVRNVQKWHPGETKAQSLYLFNHMAHRYKNKVEVVNEIGDRLAAMAFSLKRRED